MVDVAGRMSIRLSGESGSREHPMPDVGERLSIRLSWLLIATASVGAWFAIGAIVRLVA